jgi:hypothetical protein
MLDELRVLGNEQSWPVYCEKSWQLKLGPFNGKAKFALLSKESNEAENGTN